jgi:hypothetical protein
MKANAPTVKEQVMQGIAGAELPEEMYNDTAMARGGIVAFNGEDESFVQSLAPQDIPSDEAYGMEDAAAVVNPTYRSHGIGYGVTTPPAAPSPQAAGTGIASGVAKPNPVKQAVAQTIPMPKGMTADEHDALVNKKTAQLDSLSTKLFQDMNADIDKREGALSDKAKQNVYMGLMQFGIRLLGNKQVDIGEAGSAAFGDYAKAQAADAAAKAAMADKRMALQKYEIETKKGNIDAAEKYADMARKADMDLQQLQTTAAYHNEQIAVDRERNQVTREGHAVQNRANQESKELRLQGLRETNELKGKQAFLAEVDKVANSIQNNAKAQMLEITPEDSERQAMAIVAGRMKKANITMPGMDLSGIQSQVKTAYPGFKEIK